MTEKDVEERRKEWGSMSSKKGTTREDPFKGYPPSLEHYIDDDFKRSIRGYQQEKMAFFEFCRECNSQYTDPLPHDLLIYLHCYRYQGDGWEYTASWPNWAKEEWDID